MERSEDSREIHPEESGTLQYGLSAAGHRLLILVSPTKHISASCVFVGIHDSGVLCTAHMYTHIHTQRHTHKHTHAFLSKSSHNSVLHFFSLHQLSDTQQWAVTLEKNRTEGKGSWGFGRSTGKKKKRYRKCEGKRELFKGKVRRVRA